MTRLTLALPALCLALAAASAPALAQQAGQTAAPRAGQRPAAAPAQVPGGGSATLVATFNDWSAYTAQTGRSKICYALSQPKARTPANLKDTPAYLFVSFRPAENVRNEVATVLGFATKEGGDAAVTIGSTSYALVSKAQNAWIKNPADEGQAISTMSKGQAMVVSATSARGNKTSDRYSLAGFAQALDRAKKECP
jgi:invasion protein IalB